MDLYMTAPFTEAVLTTQLQTRQVDEFVCDVLLGSVCMDELGDQAEQGLTKRGCLKHLSNLPLAEDENRYVNGNSQGCRYLHAVFALTNPFHCAHVSLIPAKDPKGNYICHWSADLSPDELFTQTKIDGLYDLCGTQTLLGLDQDQKQSPKFKKIKEVGEERNKERNKKKARNRYRRMKSN